MSSQLVPRTGLERTVSAIASARRATVADRFAVNAFTAEWRPLAELDSIEADWRALAANVLEPNVFYEPAFARAAAPVFGADVGAVLVWSGTQPRKLLGLFPGQIARRRYGVGPAVLTGWTHPYAPLGTPLVAREAAEPVIAAWLAHVADDPALPGLVLLPMIVENGPFASALRVILRRAQMRCADFARHQRPLLAPGGDRGHYVENALSAHRLSELRRTGRRVADLGALMFTATGEPSGVAAALEDFLALEAAGWKGKAGTAAARSVDQWRFFKAAVNALAADGKVAINRILLDGRPIAATITLRSGDTAWYWKTAYDEAFARFAPGILVTVALTEALAEDPAIARTDSCAAPGGSILDHIWRERLALCDRLIAVRADAPFHVAENLEALRGAGLRAAKRLRARLRRRR